MLLMPLLLLAAAEADVIRETLDSAPQSPPWGWVREQRDAWRVQDGKLQIRALHGTLWKAQPNDAKNLLVRPWPAEAGEDAVVAITVRFSPERGGEQAGVMFYLGDDDYIKIVRESLENKHWIVMAREERGAAQPMEKVEETADEVTLYLVRHREQIEGSYTVAGKDKLKTVGRGALPRATGAGDELKLCLFAHGGPPKGDEARWATFSDLKVSSVTKQ